MAGLINLIAGIGFKGSRDKARDTLGRVYEYFLGKFAAAEGKLGASSIRRSVVRVLVEMLEPYAGRVYDPAAARRGVRPVPKFVEAHGGNRTGRLVFGQESNPTTWRLPHMNLAIHGIEANLGPAPADTFLRPQHPDLKADFVLANPPFNVSDYPAHCSAATNVSLSRSARRQRQLRLGSALHPPLVAERYCWTTAA
ncbi:MAG: N-6 DNA methylase [Planctomycetaceae bacterium]